MPHPDIAVVTGAFSYTGRYVARRLLDQGVRVRILARNPDREDSFASKSTPLLAVKRHLSLTCKCDCPGGRRRSRPIR